MVCLIPRIKKNKTRMGRRKVRRKGRKVRAN